MIKIITNSTNLENSLARYKALTNEDISDVKCILFQKTIFDDIVFENQLECKEDWFIEKYGLSETHFDFEDFIITIENYHPLIPYYGEWDFDNYSYAISFLVDTEF